MFDFNDSNDRIIFGKRLFEARKRKRYSQEQFAELLGIEQHTTISAWETGKNPPDCRKLSRICKVLDVDLGYLIGDYDESTYGLKRIASYTGLSEKAIEQLHKWHNSED